MRSSDEVGLRFVHALAAKDVHYRFRVENDDGERFLIEQHGYYDAVDRRITRMSLMCAGFRPWPS